jgi:hypothetical protein
MLSNSLFYTALVRTICSCTSLLTIVTFYGNVSYIYEIITIHILLKKAEFVAIKMRRDPYNAIDPS